MRYLVTVAEKQEVHETRHEVSLSKCPNSQICFALHWTVSGMNACVYGNAAYECVNDQFLN